MMNYVTLHLWLILINVLEVVILLMIDLSDILCVSNKTEDVNVKICNMITGLHESKSLMKHISCKRRCTSEW